MHTTLKTPTVALLAVAALALLGAMPASALPVVDVTATPHAGLHDGGLHVELTIDLVLGDGSSPPLFDDAVGTGSQFVRLACDGSPCTIEAASTGYRPPVAVIESGSDVIWHSTDVSHVQRETSTPVGSPVACFNASSPGDQDSEPVTFEIVGGALAATSGSTTVNCDNAVEAGGNFVVPYHCTLHPTMRGFLVVTP